MAKNQWVSPREDGWGVRGEGNQRDSKVFRTKQEAVEYGKQRAKKENGELIIQKKNGQIQSKDSYGNDPNPPKDTEH